jgi:hypothetical protein
MGHFRPPGSTPAPVCGPTYHPSMTSVESHRARNIVHVQLGQNVVLKEMTDLERDALEKHLDIVDCAKG